MVMTEHANLTCPNVTYCNITFEGALMYVCSVGKNMAICAKLQLNCKNESVLVHAQLTPPSI
jgi:hypothetical protein